MTKSITNCAQDGGFQPHLPLLTLENGTSGLYNVEMYNTLMDEKTIDRRGGAGSNISPTPYLHGELLSWHSARCDK